MKNKLLNILLDLAIFLCGVAIGLNLYDSYDVNHDRKITSQDYVLIKKYIIERNDK